MNDTWDKINNQIVDYIEKKGQIPWLKPWVSFSDGPKNMVTGNPYQGAVNQLSLEISRDFMGYNHGLWGTYKQITDLGGHVLKGEKSTLVFFWKMVPVLDREIEEVEFDDAGSKTRCYSLLKKFSVFNLDQTTGVDAAKVKGLTTLKTIPDISDVVESAENIVNNYVDGPKIDVKKSNQAFYSADRDLINMPTKGQFNSLANYYGTLFHELGHSTGAPKRLNRPDLISRIGSPAYAREELVAEFTAAFLRSEAGLIDDLNASIQDHAAYLASWLKAFKGDKKLLVVAAARAVKAAKWILGDRGMETAKAA